MVTTPLSEKKPSTKYVDEGNEGFADMPFMEKKYSTKDVEKGTD